MTYPYKSKILWNEKHAKSIIIDFLKKIPQYEFLESGQAHK